ncbi:MAG TPA: hypothetical protein VGJ55_04665 [Pyrinomonadaceae bacterium]
MSNLLVAVMLDLYRHNCTSIDDHLTATIKLRQYSIIQRLSGKIMLTALASTT